MASCKGHLPRRAQRGQEKVDHTVSHDMPATQGTLSSCGHSCGPQAWLAHITLHWGQDVEGSVCGVKPGFSTFSPRVREKRDLGEDAWGSGAGTQATQRIGGRLNAHSFNQQVGVLGHPLGSPIGRLTEPWSWPPGDRNSAQTHHVWKAPGSTMLPAQSGRPASEGSRAWPTVLT